jgi:small subunit ribosomal protein S12e
MADDEVMEETPKVQEEGGVMDLNGALQGVLKKALIHDGVARGLRECVKALDRRQAHLCILAQDCDSAEYVRLVEALAQEHSIDIIKVADGKQLGEWVGLCKLDKEGNARKVVKCSCAVVKNWGETSEAKNFLTDHLAKAS